MSNQPFNNPYVVTTKSLFSAIIVDGENKGLPLCLAELICNGTLKREDVKRRGWVYG